MAHTMAVLVIDDDEGTRETIQDTLEAEGMRVMVADGGATGIEVARAHLPDIIVCDIRMPGVDGHDVLASLRASSSTAAIPLIFLTAEATRGDHRRGMEAGAEDYVTKPFRPQELIQAVRMQLEKRDATRRRAEEALDELRGTITHMLPHELLTPLTPIVGYAGMLRNSAETLSSQDLVQIGDAIDQSAQRLERMFRNVLMYANLELVWRDAAAAAQWSTGGMESIRSPAEAAARCAAARFDREQDLRLEVQDVPVAISLEYLEEILDELMDNAFKFSPAGSPVEVHVVREEASIRIRVADHGQGMRLEDIRRIGGYLQFDRRLFEQQGSGLGLVIVKRIIDLAHGEFVLTSVLEQGTAVDVRLPSRLASARETT
jgi:two-component system, sensor histidine kinase and response regulator